MQRRTPGRGGRSRRVSAAAVFLSKSFFSLIHGLKCCSQYQNGKGIREQDRTGSFSNLYKKGLPPLPPPLLPPLSLSLACCLLPMHKRGNPPLPLSLSPLLQTDCGRRGRWSGCWAACCAALWRRSRRQPCSPWDWRHPARQAGGGGSRQQQEKRGGRRGQQQEKRGGQQQEKRWGQESAAGEMGAGGGSSTCSGPPRPGRKRSTDPSQPPLDWKPPRFAGQVCGGGGEGAGGRVAAGARHGRFPGAQQGQQDRAAAAGGARAAAAVRQQRRARAVGLPCCEGGTRRDREGGERCFRFPASPFFPFSESTNLSSLLPPPAAASNPTYPLPLLLLLQWTLCWTRSHSCVTPAAAAGVALTEGRGGRARRCSCATASACCCGTSWARSAGQCRTSECHQVFSFPFTPPPPRRLTFSLATHAYKEGEKEGGTQGKRALVRKKGVGL